MLVPRRRRGEEILDDPGVPAAVRERSLRDVARSNVLFGGRRAALLALRGVLLAARGEARPLTMLDVGTGRADIPAAARTLARRLGVELRVIGLDAAPSLLAGARDRLDDRVAGSALALPLADRSVDVVLASQLLHHFEERDALALLREMDRVARRCAIVADLRRSWIAAIGFWLAAWPLAFHRVTRHDGVLSVLRGFTAPELERLVHAATGHSARATRRLGFRLAIAWSPLHRSAP